MPRPARSVSLAAETSHRRSDFHSSRYTFARKPGAVHSRPEASLGQVAAEASEDCPCLGWREAAAVLPPCDRGGDLNGGDAGDIKRMSRLGASQRTDPSATGFRDMAFDQGAAVEKVDRHLSGARG